MAGTVMFYNNKRWYNVQAKLNERIQTTLVLENFDNKANSIIIKWTEGKHPLYDACPYKQIIF